MVTTNHENIFLDIVQRKGEDTVQIFHEVRSFFAIKRKDYFTVGFSEKFIFSFKLFADVLVIIDFTINSQHQFSIFTEQRLFTRFRIHNR